MNIGLIEDDPEQAQLIRLWMEGAGHVCEWFPNGQTYIDIAAHRTFDLMIVDWMLPDMGGDEVLKWIRTHLGWDQLVLFATARNDERDIAYVLQMGADDFMSKPLGQLEMLARIQALARRAKPASTTQRLVAEPYEFDQATHQALLEGRPVDLTRKEFDLAVLLFQNPGLLLTRDALLKDVWGHPMELDTRTVDTHISRIKKKLLITPERGWQIASIYGLGYRLEPVRSLTSS